MKLTCSCGKSFEIKEIKENKREYNKLNKNDIDNLKNDYINGLRPYLIYEKYNTNKGQVYYYTRNLQKFKK